MMNEFLKELQDSARQVMEGAGTPAKEESTWGQLVELGWLLTAVPEELDGLGLGADALCMLSGELGRNLSEAPFLPAALAIEALVQSGLENKAELLAGLTMGGELATVSLAGSDVVASGSGNSLTLNGKLVAVQSADNASQLLVWSNDKQCVALVAADQAAVEAVSRPSWDTTRRLFDVTLTGAAGVALAEGAEAAALVARLLNLRDFAMAADSLGGANALLELTIVHLTDRVQFARPLASFQALKHRCADLKVEIAAAEALLNDSLLKIAGQLGSDDAVFRGQKAKYLASAAYAKVAEECLQLSGGIGMASEYPCHLYLKRSMLSEHLGSQGSYEADIAEAFLRQLSI